MSHGDQMKHRIVMGKYLWFSSLL